MTNNPIQALVLAAGKSSRFNTSLTKLSFTICGKEMITYPLALLADMNIPTTLIVGHQKDVVLNIVKKHSFAIDYIEQVHQKGTGDAVLCTQDLWHAQTILILNGDVPLLHKSHLESLIQKHESSGATITCAATWNADPSITGYGRIIKKQEGIAIVEQRDFVGDPSEHCHFNAGIYLIKRDFLEAQLPHLPASPSGEIYITDLIYKASSQGNKVEIVDLPFDYVRGVNTLQELWVAEHIKKSDIIRSWMQHGVRFTAPQSVHIDLDVQLANDCSIGYGVQLRNKTVVGHAVHIDAFSILDNATIHDSAVIHAHCVISNAEVHPASQVGPFAHVHKESVLQAQSIIGNFVEISKSTVGVKSKVKHLAYMGNAQLGSQVNIGAGAITCNYNGVTKHPTIIKDNAFIGTNVALVAPVTIGENAYVATGSVITQNVPELALAIARERQTNKEQYVTKLKEKLSAPKIQQHELA